MTSAADNRARLSEIDRQINEVVAANPLSKSAPRYVPFPWLWWGLGLASAAAWKFGPEHLAQYIDEKIAEYCMYGAAGLGGLAVLLTLRWLVMSRSKTRKSYNQSNEKLKELRKQRAILEAQMRG